MGARVGLVLGEDEGDLVGTKEGRREGASVGVEDGNIVGSLVGEDEGICEGLMVGEEVGIGIHPEAAVTPVKPLVNVPTGHDVQLLRPVVVPY